MWNTDFIRVKAVVSAGQAVAWPHARFGWISVFASVSRYERIIFKRGQIHISSERIQDDPAEFKTSRFGFVDWFFGTKPLRVKLPICFSPKFSSKWLSGAKLKARNEAIWQFYPQLLPCKYSDFASFAKSYIAAGLGSRSYLSVHGKLS